jgi:mevalonate kinase
MASETVIHGRPSGLDHTLAAEGGFGVFTKAHGLAPLSATRPLRLLIGHTGRARDTKGRVSRVAELYAERESDVRGRLFAIEALVERGRIAIEGGSDEMLGEAMNENQSHLEALEVSCREIEEMCAIARENGALGAKLTGGGGGGCVIALAPRHEAEVLGAWERAGFRGFFATVGSDA